MEIPTDKIWNEIQPRLPAMFNTLVGGLAEWGAKAVTGAMSLATGLANLILIPVLTIYFLNDFAKLRSWTYRLFPDDLKEDALKAYRQLNEAISAFVRGQMIVCLFLATWIGAGLAIFAHLPYSILIGVAAGLLNLIPYVGTTTALIVTIAVSMFQPDPIWTAIKAVIIFSSGQTLEANLLTPRIVGDKVGLHAIVVIFLVLLFATFWGLIGMLIAIPVGAAGKVLWTVWVERQQRITAKFLSNASQA
jgi:predicted PurR-regulated permease PerM